MSNPNCRGAARRLLLCGALLSSAAWADLAAAQPTEAELAQADVDVAEAQLALALAKRKKLQLQVGPAGSTSISPSAPKPGAATAQAAPASNPPLAVRSDPASSAGTERNNVQPVAAPVPAVADATDGVTKSRKEFGGLEFGAGISFTLDLGENDRVTEAELVNGIVRVKDEDNGRARIMLESHYFFKPCQERDGTETPGCNLLFGLKPGDFGFGPFVALQPGSEEIIQAVAIGAMVGFRRPGEGTESFNLGLGVVIDPNTRILGDGIVANQPLPAGETAIRYKEEMQTGLLLLASFGF